MRKQGSLTELYEGDVKGTAARSIVPTAPGMLPLIRFTFTDTNKNTFAVEMTLEDAGKFLQQGLDAFDAALPRRPRPARQSMFDQ